MDPFRGRRRARAGRLVIAIIYLVGEASPLCFFLRLIFNLSLVSALHEVGPAVRSDCLSRIIPHASIPIAATRRGPGNGLQRFFDWLTQTGEDALLAQRAKARARIVRAVAKELKP